MNKFTKMMVVVGGFGMIAAACAPATRGNGTKIPNERAKLIKQDKATQDALSKVIHIGTVKLGTATDKDAKFTVVLAGADDFVKPEDASRELTVNKDGSKATDEVKGKSATYSLEAVCEQDCAALVVVLTQTANAAADDSNADAKLAPGAASQAVLKSGVIADATTGQWLSIKKFDDASISFEDAKKMMDDNSIDRINQKVITLQ